MIPLFVLILFFSASASAQFRLVGGGQTVTQITFNNPTGPFTSQFFVLESTSGSPINFTATASTVSGGAWLSVKVYPSETTTGTTGSSLEIRVNPTLPDGVYSGTVLFQQQGNPPVQLSIPIQMIAGGFSVDPPIVSRYHHVGNVAPTSTVVMSSNNGAPFSYTAQLTSGTSFVSITSGSTGNAAYHSVLLTFSVGGLPPVDTVYTGNLRVTITGKTETIDVPISLTVYSAYTITPTVINLAGGQNAQSVSIIPPSLSPPWTYGTTSITSSGGSWLSVTPTASLGPLWGAQSFTVIANPAGLTAGVTYTGTVRVFISAQFQDIAVNFTPGLPSGGNISGYTISPTVINLSAGQNSQTVIITPATLSHSYNYTTTVFTTSGGSWLSVSPANPPSQVTGVQSITVNANPAGLTAGVTYTGTVRVFINNQLQDISVSFTPGDPSGNISDYTITPTAITLNSASSQLVSVIPANLAQPFTFSVVSFTSTGGAWLSTISAGSTVPVTGPQSFTVVTNPAGLAAGVTYTGTIRVFIGSQFRDIPVSFTPVSSTGGNIAGYSVTPTSVTLGGSNLSQDVTIAQTTATGAYFYSTSAITSSGGNWLSVTPAAAQVDSGNRRLSIVCLPFGLTPGATYTGIVRVVINSQFQDIAVTCTPTTPTITGYSITPTSVNLSGGLVSQFVTISQTTATGAYYYSTSVDTLSGGAWLSVSPPNTTAVVAGNQGFTVLCNPSVLSAGVTYTGNVRLNINAQNQDIPVTCTPTNQPPIITTTSLNGGVMGTAYTQTLQATGGQIPYTWTHSGLPEGLTLDSATGAITGLPVNAGTHQVAITVRDSANRTATATFPLIIQRAPAQTSKLSFVPLTPCRIMETRHEYNFEGRTGSFGPPFLSAGDTRTLTLPASNVCQIPATAAAFVLNVTVIPRGPLDFVTVFPGDESRPDFRTVSSPDGQIVANSTIVRTANGGVIKVFASAATDIIIDISGYFTPATGTTGLTYYPVTPCRAVETRIAYRTPAGPFGPPSLNTRETRRFRLPESPHCTLPPAASAYSATITVVPQGPLAYLTAWPAGGPQPNVSSINSFQGRVLANHIIVPAGAQGAIDIFANDRTDLIVDITGYFAPDDGAKGLYYFPLVQCRTADTQSAAYTDAFGGPELANEAIRTLSLTNSAQCQAIPTTAKAYAVNVTAFPGGSPMPFLTIFPTGQPRPNASMLNAFEGQTVTNSTIVPAGTAGAIDLFAYRRTHAAVEIGGYFSR